MVKEGFFAFRDKRVLLLQGPVGPFFRRLARDLEGVGAHVSKVNFNGGDTLFYPTGAVAFQGRMAEWPRFLEKLLTDLKIDVVLLFGDCRPIHRAAYEIAQRRGIEIGVFEEGYIRPDYITLERHGVNGHSLIPRTPIYYLNRPTHRAPRTLQVGNTYWYAALWASLYYAASAVMRPFFRHYQHHRPLTVKEALPWLRAVWRKGYYAVRERGVQARLAGELSGKYFLVPLQLHNDSQICVHSDYDAVELFIEDVVRSYAGHAPPDTHLVIKHHPLDRGYSDYTAAIRDLAGKHGIAERVHYIHDQHLPTLLDHARGVVTVNSTVGLSALFHGAPLKVCGRAIYDMQGLTFSGSVDNFWAAAPKAKAKPDLLQRFRNYLIEHTQVNGSFYRRLKIPGSHTGLRLESLLQEWRGRRKFHDGIGAGPIKLPANQTPEIHTPLVPQAVVSAQKAGKSSVAEAGQSV
jgi:capsular polysaccharide export protein